jgi:hypothetical protein
MTTSVIKDESIFTSQQLVLAELTDNKHKPCT